jgi:hypothetical protein
LLRAAAWAQGRGEERIRNVENSHNRQRWKQAAEPTDANENLIALVKKATEFLSWHGRVKRSVSTYVAMPKVVTRIDMP